MLSLEKFTNLISNAPLVAIDLIIKNTTGVLLGKRTNQPAKGSWFVPGGRVFKNETIEQAIHRIALKEVSLDKRMNDFNFIGVFEHFYDNSFVSDSIKTHYVVLAFELEIELSLLSLPKVEHNEYHFFSLNDLRKNPLVHSNTKEYFNNKGIA